MSDEYVKRAAQIASKKYLTEMDLLRLQKYLLMARMAANSTFLVDKEEPGFSSKLERLAELLEQLAAYAERKIVLFSEWTTMLNLIEPILKRLRTRLRAARRQGAAEEAAAARASLPERSELPGDHHEQCRQHRLEPAGGQHGDQRRSALESGRARAANRPGASHGAAAARAGLPAGHGRHDRRTAAGRRYRPNTIWPWRRSTSTPTCPKSNCRAAWTN